MKSRKIQSAFYIFYDIYGRVERYTETFDGKTFANSYTYDSYGRVKTQTMPGGKVLSYTYDEIGTNTHVHLDGNLIWELTEMNGQGNITKYKFGNLATVRKTYDGSTRMLSEIFTWTKTGNTLLDLDYDFDGPTGNLLSRSVRSYNAQNQLETRSETFTYDIQDRLATWKYNNQTFSMQYDNNSSGVKGTGNITYMPGKGGMEYNEPQPHAVSSISTVNGYSPGNQELSFNAMDQVSAIGMPNNNTPVYEFSYGYDRHRRVMKEYNSAGNLISTTRYFGSYEEVEKNGQTIKRYYISTPTGLAGVYLEGANAADGMYYFHTDHLGSIRAITNDNCDKIAEFAYGAWGELQDPFEQGSTAIQLSEITTRGYTGHEHLPAVGLINMNGRLYDAALGRMMAPDNFVQSPELTGNFNRYSYCLNNPLKYTDPDGEFLELFFTGFYYVNMLIGNSLSGVENPSDKAWSDATAFIQDAKSAFSVSIYSDNSTNISAGIDIFNAGLYMSTSYRDGNTTYSASVGIGFQGWSAGGGISHKIGKAEFGFNVGGGNNHIGAGLSAKYNGYGAGYTYTHYGNAIGPDGLSNSQNVGGATLFFKDLSLRLENDFLAFEKRDRWRSNAIEIGYKGFVLGTTLYNNDPYTDDPTNWNSDIESPIWGKNKNGRGGWNNGLTYNSPLYLGYRNGLTVGRIGFSHRVFQDFTQNGVHKHGFLGLPFGYQNYYANYSEFKTELYFYSGWNNPFSLWGR
jgi:RHS repeat-associated protein